MSKGKEIEEWGAREGLAPATIKKLLEMEFTSLADLKHLTHDDIMEFFQKPKELPLPQCLALRNAIGRLSGGAPPPSVSPGQPAQPSQSYGRLQSGQSYPPGNPGFSNSTHHAAPTGQGEQFSYQCEGQPHQPREHQYPPREFPHQPQGGPCQQGPGFERGIQGVEGPSRQSQQYPYQPPGVPHQPREPHHPSLQGPHQPQGVPYNQGPGYERGQGAEGSPTQSRQYPYQPAGGPHQQPLGFERTQGAGASWQTPYYQQTGYGNVGHPGQEEVRLLLLGKTGSGKSTTGNTIFGQPMFQASSNFASVTADCELKHGYNHGRRIDIMDSPGLFDTTKNHEQVSFVIVQAVAGMHPGPNAVLYVVRVGRYTAEEFSAYNRLKALFDPNITRYTIVLFTGGDDLERKGESMEYLMQNLTGNIRTVLNECGNRYVLFNNFARDPGPQVERLLSMVRELNRQNGGPYVCPKYMTIGESLEAEVARRMQEVDKKELERQKYVQQLQQQTEAATQQLGQARQDMERKEQEQEKRMERLRQQQDQQMQLLKEQMEKQRMSDEQRLKEERELRERQEKEQREMMDKMEQQRREDIERYEKLEQKRQQLEEERREEERKLAEERERRHQEEMTKLKDEVVQNNIGKLATAFVETVGTIIKYMEKLDDMIE